MARRTISLAVVVVRCHLSRLVGLEHDTQHHTIHSRTALAAQASLRIEASFMELCFSSWACGIFDARLGWAAWPAHTGHIVPPHTHAVTYVDSSYFTHTHTHMTHTYTR